MEILKWSFPSRGIMSNFSSYFLSYLQLHIIDFITGKSRFCKEERQAFFMMFVFVRLQIILVRSMEVFMGE